MKKLLMLAAMLLPWSLRRTFLQQQFGFQIHPSAHIGLAWIFPSRLIMEEGSSIGDLTVAKNLDLLHLKPRATIGRGNWITGFPLGDSPHFASETERRPELVLGEHSAITNRHLLDCTSSITIGAFTTIAGFQSQFISHSIDIRLNRQTSRPIQIGSYCFVGTDCVVLPSAAVICVVFPRLSVA